MMMAGDPKKLAVMIVAGHKSSYSDAKKHNESVDMAPPEEEGAEIDSFDAAADEAWDAMKSNDKAAWKEAFKSAVSICMDAEDESEEPEEGSSY